MVGIVRILFSNVHGYGHLYPLFPLAAAARDAGHEITFATGAEFHPTVRKLGFDTVDAGMPIRDAFALLPEAAGGPESLSPEQMAVLPTRVFGGVLPRRFVEDLGPIIERLRPDLVVHEAGNPGAALAARIAGVPGVCHAFGRVMTAEFAARLEEVFRPLAAELGVELPADTLVGLGDPYLDICPISLQGKDFPEQVRRIPLRPVAAGEPGELPPVVLDRAEGRPLIYLTMGTAFGSADVLRQAITGLSRLPADVLVASGPSVPHADLGAVADNVTVLPWVPQAELLSHTDLVVHHGGSGTTFGSLGAGVPQLFLPQGADQFVNADMVAEAGAGTQLLGAEFDAEAVAAQANKLLTDDVYRGVAGRLADEIAAMPSPADVARRLPEFAG